jgi:nucleotide-binding universal stress UspA family protein/transposase
MGRPSLAPGRYFRLLLIGYFEGLDSERGIAWRAADSLAVRQFLGLGLDEAAPDHSTISRTQRLIDVEAHQAVFTWVQERLVEAHLLRGKTLAVDAATLEANAAMRSIVRRDTGESYQKLLTRLAAASGLKTPSREALALLDRRCKKRTSNAEWVNPSDPDAKVTQMKDGRTHLAHKVEHAVDLETGALVAVTLHGADVGDTTSLLATTLTAAEQLAAVQATIPTALVGDRGYHRNDTLLTLRALGIRAYLAEPDRGRRCWAKEPEAQTGEEAPVMSKRILVPLDTTEATEALLPIVSMLTAAGAAVRLIHVAPVPDNVVTPEGRTVAYADQEMARVQAMWSDALHDTAARLHDSVDRVVRFGEPATEILTEAEAFGADTIVVTTGTRSSVKRALLGSVAEAMLQRARIGVLLYRPPRDL